MLKNRLVIVIYFIIGLFILSDCSSNAQLPPLPIVPSAETDAGFITMPKHDVKVESQLKDSINDVSNKKQEEDLNIKPVSNIEREDPIEGKVEETVEPTILVEHIIIEGCELLNDEDISSIISKYENKNLTISEIKDAVREINNMYYDYGVLTALAYLPPQDILNNTVVIMVVEGKIGKLSVKGNKFTRPGYIKGALHQAEGDIIYLPEIKDDILAFNKHNDVKLKARVKKGQKYGTSDITIDVEEGRPYHLGFTFDNTGQDTVGVLKGGVNASFDSVLGYRDRLSVSYGRARSTNIVSTSYSVPVDHKGFRVGAAFGYGGIGISKGSLEPLNIEGKSFTYSLFATKPIIDTRRWDVDTNLSFNAKKITTYLDGESFAKALGIPSTQIRTLVGSISVIEKDKTGQWMHNSDITAGLDVFGGQESFFKYNGSLIRLQKLPFRSILILKAITQIAEDGLPSAEKFGIGGAHSVRGYLDGFIGGDNGYLFSSEVRFPLVLLPKKVLGYQLRDNVQGVVFAETGGAFDVGDIRAKNTLTSVGMGIRASLTRYLTGRVDYGFGMVNREDSQPAARLHFGLESNPF